MEFSVGQHVRFIGSEEGMTDDNPEIGAVGVITAVEEQDSYRVLFEGESLPLMVFDTEIELIG